MEIDMRPFATVTVYEDTDCGYVAQLAYIDPSKVISITKAQGKYVKEASTVICETNVRFIAEGSPLDLARQLFV